MNVFQTVGHGVKFKRKRPSYHLCKNDKDEEDTSRQMSGTGKEIIVSVLAL